MANSVKKASRCLCVLSVILYFTCFALPDHWIRWSGPVGRPRSPGPVEQYYFLPEMVSWGQPLDWAGWMGHLVLLTGFVLLAFGRSRWAVAATVLALVFGLARHATCWTMGFLAGYYVWLASMVTLGVAGGVGGWLQGTVTPAEPTAPAARPRE